MTHPLFKSAVALALAAPALALAANPQVNASLSNFRLQVIDLTPADGVAATYQVNQQTIHIDNSVQVTGGTPDADHRDLLPGAAFDSAVANDLFSAALHGNGTFGSAAASVTWNATQPYPGGLVMGSSDYLYKAELSLAPGAALVFSGSVDQSFNATGLDSNDWASSVFFATLDRRNNANGQYSASYFSSKRYGWRNGYAGWHSHSDFAITLTNSSAAAITVDLGFALMTDLQARSALAPAPGGVSPVPEPSAWMMLGAGVAVLAGSARRRRQA